MNVIFFNVLYCTFQYTIKFCYNLIYFIWTWNALHIMILIIQDKVHNSCIIILQIIAFFCYNFRWQYCCTPNLSFVIFQWICFNLEIVVHLAQHKTDNSSANTLLIIPLSTLNFRLKFFMDFLPGSFTQKNSRTKIF